MIPPASTSPVSQDVQSELRATETLNASNTARNLAESADAISAPGLGSPSAVEITPSAITRKSHYSMRIYDLARSQTSLSTQTKFDKRVDVGQPGFTTSYHVFYNNGSACAHNPSGSSRVRRAIAESNTVQLEKVYAELYSVKFFSRGSINGSIAFFNDNWAGMQYMQKIELYLVLRRLNIKAPDGVVTTICPTAIGDFRCLSNALVHEFSSLISYTVKIWGYFDQTIPYPVPW